MNFSYILETTTDVNPNRSLIAIHYLIRDMVESVSWTMSLHEQVRVFQGWVTKSTIIDIEYISSI